MSNTQEYLKFHAGCCKKKEGGCIVAIYGLRSGHAFFHFLLLIQGRLRRVGFKSWCVRYANGHSKPLSDSPCLNHQINIPSKGSSEPMVWGELSCCSLEVTWVDVCAYRNLYSWEILSTKRLDCPGGLIGALLVVMISVCL